ncbi:DUF4112 domain-containing protein [Sphingobacterium sp. HJSM2_6]|uniref:DUF4112 domain-containing protein n=1 Tax=Sphingobacterium sp. HJSM2_6 TaxID=3366264 RepID=UPI003BE9EBA6
MTKNHQIQSDNISKDFLWVERLSNLLDSRFRIGNFRFGLDPILNFIPFAGQITTFFVSLCLVIVMYRNGASSKLAVKMLLNITWDALLGSIPLFGNIFDFFNKANNKNINLLKEHYYDNKHQGSAKGILLVILAVFLILITAFIYLMYLLTIWLIQFIF